MLHVPYFLLFVRIWPIKYDHEDGCWLLLLLLSDDDVSLSVVDDLDVVDVVDDHPPHPPHIHPHVSLECFVVDSKKLMEDPFSHHSCPSYHDPHDWTMTMTTTMEMKPTTTMSIPMSMMMMMMMVTPFWLWGKTTQKKGLTHYRRSLL